jgi:hypothetical protein
MPGLRLPATALAVLLALGACGGDRPPWADGAEMVTARPPAGPQDLSDFASRIVGLHNRERTAVGTPPLTWDSTLAAAAAAYGPALAARGSLAHSPPESRPGQGENLWMGTSGAFSIEEMVGSWAAEKALFVAGIVPNVSRSGHFSDVGHYTQMIWRASARIGCALHRARSADYLICRYSPPGNVVGQQVP